MDISEIYDLPIDEKLRIVTSLWDSIAASDDPVKLSPAVIAEIERRRQELASDSELAIDRDELWRRVSEAKRNRTKSDG